ncbi:uncharacterized protein L969DRAFT_33861, partial [Mixia osmundae IAM 14324]|uniref:uncharacterized protein n=1 Tax=Mixia osmundae (strain CBS 9802 / IAM 14324 / JCM 22182 / KY 12970) TaxID=764103 RepID=UPI0004A54D88
IHLPLDFLDSSAPHFGHVSETLASTSSDVLAEPVDRCKYSRCIKRNHYALRPAKTNAGKSPIAVQGGKHLLDYSRDHSVQDGLAYTATWNMSQLQASDLVEAV